MNKDGIRQEFDKQLQKFYHDQKGTQLLALHKRHTTLVQMNGWNHSLTAHQLQKGHTMPKQVIMIATSIQVATV